MKENITMTCLLCGKVFEWRRKLPLHDCKKDEEEEPNDG